MTDKFLPHLDFRDVKFDEEKQRIYVSDAVDSQIQVYDLKGSWKQSFGVKGKNMPQQPYEFVKHFDLDKYVHQNRSFVYFLDSLNFCSSYYYRMVANHDFSLIARNYLVPDSVKIVPGNEVGYSTSLLHQNSVLKIKKYVQIYKHRKLIVDENVPYTWVMIGFWQDKLLFYRLEHIEDSERYILHLYKIEI